LCENEEIVKLLISYGANAHAKDENGESILDNASKSIREVILQSLE